MKTMNILEQAQNLVREREEMINNATKVLEILGAQIGQQTIINNNITINKGKIVEVETIKEVVKTIEVTNEEEIENLYKENRRHIERINQLVVKNDELEDELKHKELLLNEFRDNMDEKIKTIHDLERQLREIKTQMNKPVVEKKETKIETPVVEETTKEENENYLYQIKLEKQKDIYRNDAKFVDLVTRHNAIVMDDKITEITRTRRMRGAMQQINQRKAELDNIESVKELIDFTTVEGVEHDGSTITKEVEGTIILSNVKYNFKATRNHMLPLVFGCMDKKQVEEAASIITKAVPNFNFMDIQTSEDKVYYSDDIVVWQMITGEFKGYTRKYQFVWDGKSEYPEGHQFHAKTRKPMNPNRGTVIAKDCQLILATCKDLMANKTNDNTAVTDDDMELDVLC